MNKNNIMKTIEEPRLNAFGTKQASKMSQQEKLFKYLISDITKIKSKTNKNLVSIINNETKEVLFEVFNDDNTILCSLREVWYFFTLDLTMSDIETQEFLNKMVQKHLGYKGYICNRMLF
jgi:phosphoribosyl-ATP pyrophosphohydrolase